MSIIGTVCTVKLLYISLKKIIESMIDQYVQLNNKHTYF